MSTLNGWHKGECAIQRKLGYAGAMAEAWTWIHSEMPEQHQTFYTSRLPFIPVTTIDDKQRPWSSILAGPDGRPGFATSQHFGELTLHANTWEGDPFVQNVKSSGGNRMLIAGIGVEFSTRRRNKFAGFIESFQDDGPLFHVRSTVNEAIGNCPKYINIRELVPMSDTHPRVVHRRLELSPDERLPHDVISFIHESDTLFLGTYYKAEEEDREKFPSHVGMNHRGGKAGFARVRPSDGRTLVIPDYSGNRLLTSLGNIEATPLAGVTFVSFTTGAVLYLTGDAHNLVGPTAQRLMPRTNALTTFHITGYIFVADALPVRQKPGTSVHRSPYSPPIHLLAEETASIYFNDLDEQPKVTLTSIEIHSKDLATFSFESLNPLHIVPGQTAILDFKSFVGALPYAHMAPDNPITVNDDRIRTWTISGSSCWSASSSKEDGPVSFSLTMRHKPGGTVTSALFSIAHKLGEFRPELLKDSRPLQLSVPLMGITGDFTLGASPNALAPITLYPSRKLLWAAGGIGLTPFLAMLAGLRGTADRENEVGAHVYNIILVLSTREPEVLLPLITRAARCSDDDARASIGSMTIHIFSRSPLLSSILPTPENQLGLTVDIKQHAGRLSKDTFRGLGFEDVAEREAYVCGPEEFEEVVLGALSGVGVDSDKVRREGFAY